MYTAMIVDDEYPARNMLTLLADWNEVGFKLVGEAENGKTAMEIYTAFHPDLIITDIQMPIMDGIELIKNIRTDNLEQCIVILSCHESFAYAQKAIRLGVTDYLIKDLLTTEQIKNCLVKIKGILDKRDEFHKTAKPSIGHRANPRASDENYEQLKVLYPIQFSTTESRMSKFYSSLNAKDYDSAQRQIQKMYQSAFTGIMQYNYLKHINKFIYTRVVAECEKNDIPLDVVFDEEIDSDELLLTHKTPQEVCDMLCSWVERLKQSENPKAPYSIRIKNIVDYINDNYYQDIGLQSVAECFEVHKVYLARIFKAETGKTLIDYLNSVRIEKAKMLLSITEDKTNDIAYTVGFNNTQNFYAAFKKYASCSPTEYRVKIRR